MKQEDIDRALKCTEDDGNCDEWKLHRECCCGEMVVKSYRSEKAKRERAEAELEKYKWSTAPLKIDLEVAEARAGELEKELAEAKRQYNIGLSDSGKILDNNHSLHERNAELEAKHKVWEITFPEAQRIIVTVSAELRSYKSECETLRSNLKTTASQRDESESALEQSQKELAKANANTAAMADGLDYIGEAMVGEGNLWDWRGLVDFHQYIDDVKNNNATDSKAWHDKELSTVRNSGKLSAYKNVLSNAKCHSKESLCAWIKMFILELGEKR